MAREAKKTWRWATLLTFALSGLLVALALVSLDDGKVRVTRLPLPVDLQRCTRDADCTLVDKLGCCACESGGARGAINGNQTDALRRFLKHACRRRGVCVRIDTCQDDLVPACVEGRCVARADNG